MYREYAYVKYPYITMYYTCLIYKLITRYRKPLGQVTYKFKLMQLHEVEDYKSIYLSNLHTFIKDIITTYVINGY